MSKRLFLLGIFLFAMRSRAVADSLEVRVFPLTGEVQLHNTNAAAVPFVYLSVTSSTGHVGALNPTLPKWHSISDFYDLSGNGFIDPTHDWTKLAATSTELTEGALTPPATSSLAGLRSITVGSIWNPGVVAYTDLAFDIRQDGWPAVSPVTVTIQTAVAGDYDHNGIVNLNDYTVWRQNFGSTTLLDADGDLDGVVDAADFVVWRKNLGKSWPGSGSSAGGGLSVGLFNSSVPEPTSAVLIWSAASAFLLRAGRRRVA